MKRLIAALVAVVVVSCGKPRIPVPELNGRVVNAATSAPLAGAKVLAVWDAEVDVLVDSQVTRIRQCRTHAAVDGTFSIAAWQAPANVNGHVRARTFAYLPGYNTRPIDTAVDHPGPERVDHFLFAVLPGESAASDDLVLEKTDDCAAGFPDGE